jgi:exopolysaccharide biosynthesis WecB/TagA/CpsF family protein
MTHTAETILGLSFFTGSLQQSIESALSGGLVLAPSGPGLAKDLIRSLPYRNAALNADLLLTDSSVMVAIYRLATGREVPRHSGLKFLQGLIKQTPERLRESSLWVMPSEEKRLAIKDWLNSQDIVLEEHQQYVAPYYKAGEVFDDELVRRIEEQRPAIIVVNIGGGTQEVLGHWLKSQLSYKPTIICTGAAIEFLAGTQVRIPRWADSLGLGWLWRCVSQPSLYVPRYWEARSLIPMILSYRGNLPPMQPS